MQGCLREIPPRQDTLGAYIFIAAFSTALVFGSILSMGVFTDGLVAQLESVDTPERAALITGLVHFFFLTGAALPSAFDTSFPRRILPESKEFSFFLVGIVLWTLGYALSVVQVGETAFDVCVVIGAIGGGIFYGNAWKIIPAVVNARLHKDAFMTAVLFMNIAPHIGAAVLSYASIGLESTCTNPSSWYCMYYGYTWIVFSVLFVCAFAFVCVHGKILREYEPDEPRGALLIELEGPLVLHAALFQVVYYVVISYLPVFVLVRVPEASVKLVMSTFNWGAVTGAIFGFIGAFGEWRQQSFWSLFVLLATACWFACARTTPAVMAYAYFLGLSLGGNGMELLDRTIFAMKNISIQGICTRTSQLFISMISGHLIAMLINAFAVATGTTAYMIVATTAAGISLAIHVFTFFLPPPPPQYGAVVDKE